METLIIIAGGLIGGGSSFKKNFLSVWLWYINTIFALVPALGLTPLTSTMLDLPFLPGHLRVPVTFFVLFIVCLILLFKISEQILPNPEQIDNYPMAAGKPVGAVCGFLTGSCYAAIIVYLAGSIPMLEGTISTGKFKRTGAAALYKISYSAAFQSVPEEKSCLRAMNALEEKTGKAVKKEKAPAAEIKEKAPRKTRQETDREMIQKIDQIEKTRNERKIREGNPGFSDEKKKFRKKRRKKRRSQSAAQHPRLEGNARQMLTSGAMYEDEPLQSGVPVPDKQDVKNAAAQARRSLNSTSVYP